MAGWESLRADLRQLLEESPDAFMVLQDPVSEQRGGRPIHIELAAWATDIAAAVNAKYGSFVDLHVGAMTVPGGQLSVKTS
ncbi:hypothetical protein AB0L64_30770 [Kribbella sp. NPDC051936]|uniref:hypothetical protein n=1 Tax=Kribbella sp. NPDC051936 TaxID=3154946 RepID=UPI003438545E